MALLLLTASCGERRSEPDPLDAVLMQGERDAEEARFKAIEARLEKVEKVSRLLSDHAVAGVKLAPSPQPPNVTKDWNTARMDGRVEALEDAERWRQVAR